MRLRRNLMTKRNLALLNVVFILVFLNLWDFLLSREILNAMMIGVFMFAPIAVLWFIGRLRSEVLITLISIFELVVMLVFVLQGFSLSELDLSSKTIFWIPFLVVAGFNSIWGLKFYSEYRESLSRNSLILDKSRNREKTEKKAK